MTAPNESVYTDDLHALLDAYGWTLLSPLDAGGMGRVYTVSEPALGRRLALKVARGEKEGFAWKRLRREARITAEIAGSGVVSVHNVGTLEDGRPWFTMTLVEGESLSVRQSRAHGQAERRALVPLLTRLSGEVARIHRLGVIHRDLKPANILVREDDRVTILDWGLARHIAEDAAPAPEEGQTRRGARLGTPAYMSPEQASGLPVDARADVWALGILLWETLAGRRAYPGERFPEVVAQILRGPPPLEPIQWAGPSLVSVVQAALAPLSERLADAGALHAALAVRPIRRRWAGAAGWAGLGLLVGALGWLRPIPEPVVPQTSDSMAETMMSLALDAAREGRGYRAELLAADALQAGAPDHLRGLLLPLATRPTLLVRKDRPKCNIGEQFSPYGALLICANTGQTTAYTIDEDGAHERWRQGVEIHEIQFQGVDLVLGQVPAQEQIVRLSAAHGGPEVSFSSRASGQLTQSRHTDILLRLTAKGRSRIFFDGQRSTFDERPGPCQANRAMVLPDGSELHACAEEMLLLDGQTLEVQGRWAYPEGAGQVVRLALSQDNQHLALLMYSGHVGVISLDGTATWTEPISRAGSIAISKTGRYVAVGGFIETVAWATDGGGQWRLPGVGRLVAFDDQERLITLGSRDLDLWQLPEEDDGWMIGGRVRELEWGGAGLLARRSDGAVLRHPEQTPFIEDAQRVASDVQHDRIAVTRSGGRVQVVGAEPISVGMDCLGLEWMGPDTLLCAPNAPGPVLIDTRTGDLDHSLGVPGTSWFTASGFAGRLALLEWSGTIWTTDSTAQPLRRSSTHPWSNVIAVAPSGQSVALGGSWGVGVLSLADGTITQRLETNARVGRLAYSPDGRWLAVTTYQGELFLYQDGALVVYTLIDDTRALPVAFSPDSTRLAVGGASGRVRQLVLSEIDRPLEELIASAHAAWGAR